MTKCKFYVNGEEHFSPHMYFPPIHIGNLLSPILFQDHEMADGRKADVFYLIIQIKAALITFRQLIDYCAILLLHNPGNKKVRAAAS